MELNRLIGYVQEHSAWSDKRIAKHLWRHRVRVADVRAARQGRRCKHQPMSANKLGTVCSPISQLIDQFDDVKKARETMSGLPQDHFVADDDLRRRLHISPDRWRTVVQHKDVAGFRYRLPNGKIVWMHPAAQEALSARIRME